VTTSARSFPAIGLVTRDYAVQYADPIEVPAAATVRVERQDPDVPAWWWCVAADGRAGWVPRELLEPTPTGPGVAVVRTTYSARELAVSQGDSITIHREYAGWYLVQAGDGQRGWVPCTHVR
jgi:hypothetical protein